MTVEATPAEPVPPASDRSGEPATAAARQAAADQQQAVLDRRQVVLDRIAERSRHRRARRAGHLVRAYQAYLQTLRRV